MGREGVHVHYNNFVFQRFLLEEINARCQCCQSRRTIFFLKKRFQVQL